MKVEAHPTSFVSRRGERGVLLIVRNSYSYPVRFEAGGVRRAARPHISTHLVPADRGKFEVLFETGERFEVNVAFREPRRFRVYIAPTFHTDWGYTDVQYNVEKRYRENFERIVEMAGRGVKFNAEVIWQIPEDLLEKVGELNSRGLIGVQAFPLNILTGLCSHEEIVRIFYPARDLRRRGFRISVAALNDIPSAVWSLPTILRGCGIEYYIQASNPDRGPLHALGEFESPAYWVGPDGSRVLAWFSGGYKGLIPGFHGYHQGLSAGLLSSLEDAEAGVALFLHHLEARGYPYEEVLMYGMFTDNDRVSDKFERIVGEFNDRWENPTLIIATTDEFFEEIRRKGARFPEVVGDLGSYWEDGAASSARELAMVREAKRRLFFAEAAYTMDYLRGLPYPSREIESAWRDIMYFDEHTWGDAGSIWNPFSWRQAEQWRIKSLYAYEAYHKAYRLTHGEYVSNPHPFPVEGVVEGSHYRLAPMSSSPLIRKELRPIALGSSFETDHYVLKLRGGRIYSLTDKDSGEELVEPEGFNEYILVLGGRGTYMERTILDYYYEGRPSDPAYTIYKEYRQELTGAWENSDVVVFKIQSWSYLSRIEKTIILPKARKEVIIENTVEKADNYDKEGIYFSFPFALEKPTVLVELPGVFMDIAREQVKGACSEWFSINSLVMLKGRVDIALYSEDAPLITVNDIFRGRWRSLITPENGRIFSYIMNNYWHTNYKASQSGVFRFRYRLTSGRDLKPSTVSHFFSPLFIGRRVEGDLYVEPRVIVTTIKKWDLGDGVVLRMLEPDDEDKIVRIRSSMMSGMKILSANLVEEPKEELGTFEGEASIRVRARSYYTLIFSRERA